MQTDNEEEETKDEPMTDADHITAQEELQRRGRGRPRKGDTTEYKPSPQLDRNKRIKNQLQQIKELQESETVETI